MSVPDEAAAGNVKTLPARTAANAITTMSDFGNIPNSFQSLSYARDEPTQRARVLTKARTGGGL
jgi:hypothetical protein